MSLVRRLARPMLASMFVMGGVEEVRNAAALSPTARRVTDKVVPLIQARVPSSVPLPSDPPGWVRLNGVVKVGAGLMLATGRFPRLAALVLAGSLAPTTIAGHPFWQEQDAEAKAEQRRQFYKNVSMTGGLLIAAVDLEPSARERVEIAARRVKRRVTPS
jgi:putative oxidoreductase